MYGHTEISQRRRQGECMDIQKLVRGEDKENVWTYRNYSEEKTR